MPKIELTQTLIRWEMILNSITHNLQYLILTKLQIFC